MGNYRSSPRLTLKTMFKIDIPTGKILIAYKVLCEINLLHRTNRDLYLYQAQSNSLSPLNQTYGSNYRKTSLPIMFYFHLLLFKFKIYSN